MTLNEPESIRKAFACFATGVAVATTRDREGRRVGMTISSFNSVSIDPPLVLWSIGNDSLSYDAFTRSGYFAVNVLAEHQQAVSERFAARGGDKFASLDCTTGLHGVPILPDYAACFECSVEYRYAGGDHMIIVGRVLRFDDRELEPLIFYRGDYHGTRDRS